MDNQDIFNLIDIPFSFQKRPSPLYYPYRTVWGISILVLILHVCSRGKRSSITRLHILNWATRNSENQTKIVELLEGRLSRTSLIVSHDPGFDRAIEYSIAEGLAVVEGKARIKLVAKGIQMAKEIMSIEDCLLEEKVFLQKKGSSLTEGLSASLLKLP
ncbi:hypothetical protein [Phormidium tenue]|uniref:Uncharacterized protein n=1 Tax=Phormidium tenue NIES-30 TaxID=549789 RepID=A0A1U7IZF5_9CYAN|nr:hypothetical protein [Phormidium tenue]MBD2234402.1 hypothetical protein [Phormidium tenue FACHB-1052]OKH44513.1 hypothetical protein NIES30_22080 [Phormidium tenue NIES-30]